MPQRTHQIVTKLCALLLLFVAFSASAGDLLIRVSGLQDSDAELYVALVPAEQKDWQPIQRELRGKGEHLRLPDVPPGQYAIQLFQDTDGDGKLALSPRGIPREPVVFSGNPSLFTGKPSPRKSRFEHGEEDTQLELKLHTPRNKP